MSNFLYPGFLSVASIAALEGADPSNLKPGCMAFVAGGPAYYQLTEGGSPPAADGVNILLTADGTSSTRRWILMPFNGATSGVVVPTTKTSALTYNVLPTDVLILVDASANAVQVNLPTGLTTDRVLYIKDWKRAAAKNNITINAGTGTVPMRRMAAATTARRSSTASTSSRSQHTTAGRRPTHSRATSSSRKEAPSQRPSRSTPRGIASSATESSSTTASFTATDRRQSVERPARAAALVRSASARPAATVARPTRASPDRRQHARRREPCGRQWRRRRREPRRQRRHVHLLLRERRRELHHAACHR